MFRCINILKVDGTCGARFDSVCLCIYTIFLGLHRRWSLRATRPSWRTTVSAVSGTLQAREDWIWRCPPCVWSYHLPIHSASVWPTSKIPTFFFVLFEVEDFITVVIWDTRCLVVVSGGLNVVSVLLEGTSSTTRQYCQSGISSSSTSRVWSPGSTASWISDTSTPSPSAW